MAHIIFTRTERYGVVIRRYGEFSYTVATKGVTVDGRMTCIRQATGDEEIKTMIQELALAWKEHKEILKSNDKQPKAPDRLDWEVKKGAGVNPKVGPFRAIKAPGVVVKMTEKGTEIVCTDLLVSSTAHAKALAGVFQDAIGERDELRRDVRDYQRNPQPQR